MLRSAYVNPRRMQIQRWKSVGCICVRSLPLSFAGLLCHIVVSAKVKFDGLGQVANRHYETFSRVEPGSSHATGTKSLIARNRSHTRKRTPPGTIFAPA